MLCMPGSPKKAKKTARPKKSALKSRPKKKGSARVRKPGKGLKKLVKKFWKQIAASFAALVVFTAVGVAFHSSSKKAPEPAETLSLETDLGHARTPLDLAFEKARALGRGDRISFWGEFIVKNPAILEQAAAASALSSQVTDSVPLLKPQYDCTTFVETVSSLARSRAAAEWIPSLLKIRYAHSPYSFENRNHFPELDWLPNNMNAQVLADTTQSLAAQHQVTLHREVKFIDRQAWLNAQVRHGQVTRQVASVALQRWSDPGQMTQAEVPYIALNDFLKIVDQIPSGTLINIVRKNDSRHPVLISHQGFLIRNAQGKAQFHHASVGGTVQSVPWKNYQHRLAGMSKIWPVLGVNLAELQLP